MATLPDPLIVSRVDEVTLRRPRAWTSLRASLVASVVALATVFALIGAYVRAPDAVLGVAFARACAAESAVTERSHPRLRVDREDVHVVVDVDGLPDAPDATKSVETCREREGESPPPSLTVVAGRTLPDAMYLDGEHGLDWLPVGPPTRERARLMVFLN
ncbi:MAG: hypothetical protein K0S65_986 [Labilithrix sp.]|nr:hypothetical protein [Labilithrix sp.]